MKYNPRLIVCNWTSSIGDNQATSLLTANLLETRCKIAICAMYRSESPPIINNGYVWKYNEVPAAAMRATKLSGQTVSMSLCADLYMPEVVKCLRF